jgi:hypothetical protein
VVGAYRFILWSAGVRLCDRVRGPSRMPGIRDIGSCLALHPFWLLPRFVPDRWWDVAGWRTPVDDGSRPDRP